MSLRVAVDATELAAGRAGGVRTALWLLLGALRRHAAGLELAALAPQEVGVPPGVRLVVTGGPKTPRRWRRCAALRRALRDFDVFHSPVTAHPPELEGGPALTATVHELPFVVRPSLEGPVRMWVQWRWLRRAMVRCAAVVVPTEATRMQVITCHPGLGDRLHVVAHPCPPVPAAPGDGPPADDGSILYVGRLDKRKAVGKLLEGARDHPGEIRLVGPHRRRARRALRRLARRLGVAERLRFRGLVDDAELDRLYRRARAVGVISVSEGFGFPVLEALGRGVPVLVAWYTGAAEVGGDAVLRVDPKSPSQIRAALQRAGDPEYRREIARRGPERAAEFTPERTAVAYGEVFRRAAGR
ncbi:MAG: glycosyltransferase [Planctomycetota bacterium]